MVKDPKEERQSKGRPLDSARQFEVALQAPSSEKYVLRLYVAGTTPRSMRAIESIKRVCRDHLSGRYHLEVIDVYVNVESVRQDDIVAVPTLIKELPTPLRRLIGDLSSEHKILVGLGLYPKEASEGTKI